ncbi:Uncharacterized, partial [Syntrophomonas zehnderi OL-4]
MFLDLYNQILIMAIVGGGLY